MQNRLRWTDCSDPSTDYTLPLPASTPQLQPNPSTPHPDLWSAVKDLPQEPPQPPEEPILPMLLDAAQHDLVECLNGVGVVVQVGVGGPSMGGPHAYQQPTAPTALETLPAAQIQKRPQPNLPATTTSDVGPSGI